MPGMIESQIISIRDRMMRRERMSSDEVLSWAQSENVELMGAAYDALLSSDRIDGVIDSVQADRFLVAYLVLIIEGRGVDAHVFQMQPYIGAHELARWYKRWRGSPAPEERLTQIRNELSRLYASGDDQQRRRVVDGVLEHLFEDASCRADFESWKGDPILGQAHKEATEWIEGRH